MRRQFIVVSVLSGLAQAAGFLKLWLTARLFGVGAELDGYYLALVVPTLVSGLVSGVLQTALFPVRARLAAEADSAETGSSGADTGRVARFERGVLVVLALAGLLAFGLLLAAAGPILALTEGHSAPAVHEAALLVLPFALLLIPLNAVGDCLGYLLAMRQRYPAAAAAPIANAAFGTFLLAVWPEGGLLNLAIGTAGGLVLQVAICAAALRRTGFALFGALPARREAAGEWREMIRIAAWIVPGVAFANLTATLPTVFVAAHGEGAVSAFGYAWRFHQFAIQLLIMAASPVLLAHFSGLVAAGDEGALRRLLRKSVLFSAALGLFAVAAVAFAGGPALQVVFGGRFDAAAASRVAEHWFWLSLGLGPALLGSILAKVWQARGRAGLMTGLAGLGLATFLLSQHLLAGLLGPFAVPAAIGVSSLAVLLAGWQSAWNG